jgi:hypothetical protein
MICSSVYLVNYLVMQNVSPFYKYPVKTAIFITWLAYYVVKLALLITIFVKYNTNVVPMFNGVLSAIDTIVVMTFLVCTLASGSCHCSFYDCFCSAIESDSEDKDACDKCFTITMNVGRRLLCYMLLVVGDIPYAITAIIHLAAINGPIPPPNPNNAPDTFTPLGQPIDPIIMTSYIMTLIVTAPAFVMLVSGILLVVAKCLVLPFVCCCGDCR